MTSEPIKPSIKIEFRQQDWIPGFAAFRPSATTPDGDAFFVLNVGSLMAVVETGDLPREELPYLVAETMMHEIIHALEQWAGVEFSEDRVDALLEKYREAYRHDQ